MYVCMYIRVYIYIYVYTYIYIYVYVYIEMCVCVGVYIHIYCIFEIHQLCQSGFSKVYSNACCSCSFEP